MITILYIVNGVGFSSKIKNTQIVQKGYAYDNYSNLQKKCSNKVKNLKFEYVRTELPYKRTEMEKIMEQIKNVYGYGRISAKDQNEARQIKALLDYGITEENIFIDKKSGKDFDREQYQLLKQILKRTKNNLLVIKSIDRLGRNYKEIQTEWQELMEYTDIKVLDMPLLDTTLNKDLLGNFISDLILQVLSFVAEQERTNIKERQRQGIEIAKLQGKYKGGKKRIKMPNNFEEEYNKWKLGQQTAKVTMENCLLKRTSFYAMVKEFEKRKLL